MERWRRSGGCCLMSTGLWGFKLWSQKFVGAICFKNFDGILFWNLKKNADGGSQMAVEFFCNSSLILHQFRFHLLFCHVFVRRSKQIPKNGFQFFYSELCHSINHSWRIPCKIPGFNTIWWPMQHPQSWNLKTQMTFTISLLCCWGAGGSISKRHWRQNAPAVPRRLAASAPRGG